MQIDVTQIIQSCIAIVVVVLTGIIIPWIRSNTTNNQKAIVESTIKTLVYAAEQLQATGVINIPKKEWVLHELNAWLGQKKIVFNEDEVNAMIEAAVRELNIEQGTVKKK